MEINYLIGNKKSFVDFVNSISKEDKIGIFTHIDLDGISSAIFLQKILESKGLKIEFIEFIEHKPRMFQEAIKNKKIDKLFISDLGFDFKEDFYFLSEKCDVFVVDHHKPYEGFEEIKNMIKSSIADCCAFVLYDLAKEFFDVEDWSWLVCAAMIADFSYQKGENLKFIQSFYPEVTLEDIHNSVPGKTAQKISSALIYYEISDFRKVYDLVLDKNFEKFEEIDKIIKKEIGFWEEKFYEEVDFPNDKRLYFYYFEPKFKITSMVSTRISDKNEGTFVCASPSFVYENKIKISARNQSGKVDVSELLKKSVKRLKDSDAGGHLKSAAALIHKEDLEKFKENLFS